MQADRTIGLLETDQTVRAPVVHANALHAYALERVSCGSACMCEGDFICLAMVMRM